MTTILLSDLRKLAELVPDLPLGQAAPVLEWIAGSRNAVVQLAAPADPAVGGGSAMADPSPAAPAVAAAGAAADEPIARGERWSGQEKERAWALKLEGFTARQIAEQFGRTVGATEIMIKRLRADRAPVAKGRYGVARTGERLRQPPWSPDEIRTAEALRADGASYVEIGAQLGRTAKAVQVALGRERKARATAAALPEIPQEDPADVERSAPPEAPCDAGDPAAVRLVDDGRGSGAGSASARGDIGSGSDPVPAVVEPRDPAPGADEQPAGLGDLGGMVVADAPRYEPAPIAPPAGGWATGLSMRQNWLLDHLRGLSDDFTPEDDLYLVEGLLSGTPAAVIADQLGCNLKAVAARFRSMQTEEILTVKGQLTLSGQQDLLVAARYRAGRHE